jgi:protein O-GlcNAc transferase
MEVELSYNGIKVKFKVTNKNDHQQMKWVAGGFYEPDLLDDLYKRTRNMKHTFYDIGACFGNHSMFAEIVCGSGVVAFEPNAYSRKIFMENRELNHCWMPISPLVLSYDYSAYSTRHVPSNNVGMARFNRNESGPYGSAPLDSTSHATFRPPTILKIDVEGMEMDVLRGAKETIRKNHPIIYVEIEGDTKECDDFLGQFGYERKAVFNATPTYLYISQ